MANFEIKGKEYELKLTFESVKRLNGLYDGGAYELIGKAMMGDIETFVQIVHAGLLHTGEKFTLKDVEARIVELFEAEQIDQDAITKVANEVVTNSFFYKKMVDKLMADNTQAKAAIDKLTK